MGQEKWINSEWVSDEVKEDPPRDPLDSLPPVAWIVHTAAMSLVGISGFFVVEFIIKAVFT